MSPLADRRSRSRYEVVGVLRGTLEVSEPARVRNISRTGALIETSTPIPVGAIQAVQITLEGHSSRITSRVRHITLIGQPPEPTYAIGLEFLSPPEAVTLSVTNLIAEAQAE